MIKVSIKNIFGGNKYNFTKFAGAFGDLGTLVPFVVGYVVINKIDPVGILVSLGILKIFAGFYFKTPAPIQPMKAIGAAAITNAGTVTQGMIWSSGLFTAVIWQNLNEDYGFSSSTVRQLFTYRAGVQSGGKRFERCLKPPFEGTTLINLAASPAGG